MGRDAMSAEEVAAAVVQAATLALAFGRVERRPYHPDETQRESDTDHTVMLGLVAPALADMLYPGQMDIGLVAQFAIVHDLAEVYAGDVPTVRNLSTDVKAAKAVDEAAAVRRISEEFGASLPWMPRTLRMYEDQLLPEARFVRAADKLLPKAVVLQERTLLSLREIGLTPEEHDDHMGPEGGQATEMGGYAGEWPEVLKVRDCLVSWLTSRMREAALGSY
jgi:5'-deoxynucleotidase YfbR-like HD superfamily hydrolase